MRDILLVTSVLLCAAQALRRPIFGMYAFVLFSLLLPHSLTWGYARTFPFAQMIALGTLVGYVFSDEPKRIPLRRESVIVLLLWLLFGVTSFLADYPDLARVKYVELTKILLMVFLTMAMINTRERLRILMLIFSMSLGFHAIKGGFFFILRGGGARVWGPEGSFLEANNAIGLALAMNLPLLVNLMQLEKNVWLRRTMMAMVLFTYPAVIGTFSRGAWLGLVAGTLLLVWKSKHRFLLTASALIVVLIAIPFLPDRVVSRYDDLVHYDEDDSAMSRVWTWRFATRVALANPISGAGFDYYGIPAYEKYWPRFRDRWPDSLGWSCHSIWFTVLSEHGFPAFGLWLVLLASCFFSLRAMNRRSRARPDEEWLFRYTNMLAIALISYSISGTFLDAAYFDILWQLIAVIVMLKEILARQDAFDAVAPQVAVGDGPPARDFADVAGTTIP